MKFDKINPCDIEQRSFEIITQMLGDKKLDSKNEKIIKRVIHTSADFDYADNLYFSDNVAEIFKNAIKNGADIVTDTQMAKSGINKNMLAKFGGKVHCFISDEGVAQEAKSREITRSIVSMERASLIEKPIIFAIGNAPTALIRLKELIDEHRISPVGIIGVPVGFVNVIESKERIMEAKIPCIIARGRKGGSNIAAAICNSILYMI